MPVVWIVNHYAQVPSGPGGTRHYSLARHLLSKGWNPVILASSCEHNTGRQRLPRGQFQRLERCDGVDFLWFRILGEPCCSVWQRLITMLLFAFTILLPNSTRELSTPDVVIGSTVHPFAAFAAYLLARRHRVDFVFEVRDLWPSTLVAMGTINSGGLIDLGLGMLERWLAHRASKVVVLMRGGIDYYNSLGIPLSRLLWLPNGCELSGAHTMPASCDPRPFQLLYCGAHGQANALEILLYAMSELEKRGIGADDILLRFIGDGPSKHKLQALANQLRLNSVRFEPAVPKYELPDLLTEADAFVVSMQPLPELYRYGISFNKLFDYFSASRPIVSASCAAYDPVSAADAGIVVPAGDSLALADGIQHLINLPYEERLRLGVNGRTYLEANHSYSLLAERLSFELNELFVAK